MGSTMGHSASRLRRIVAVVVVALIAAALAGLGTTPAQATAQHPGYVSAIGNRAIGQTDLWGMASYYCTSYAAYRVNRAGTVWRSNGEYDARQWDDRARERGITVSRTPKKGAVAVWEGASWNGGFGHVAYVESVNSNGTANVSEYNYDVKHGYGTRSGARAVRADWYIHFQSAPPPRGIPFGNFDGVKRAPGGVFVNGWAIDPDTKGAIRVHTYGGTGSPGGNPNVNVTADKNRADVGRAYPKYGPHHGYQGLLLLPHGSQKVCSYAINAPGTPGTSKQIGCKPVAMSPHPFGTLDMVKPVPGGVEVVGWAVDPDTASPIRVHVYGGSGDSVPSNPILKFTAEKGRADVGRHLVHYGDNHGFENFFALSPGEHTVCAYAINASGTAGSNQRFGCKTVTVA